jgi:uncharacterized FAD-dependent dehydrogenase
VGKTFAFILRGVTLPEGLPETELVARAARRLGCETRDILDCRPVRRSRDARRRNKRPLWVYQLRLAMPLSWRKRILAMSGLDLTPEPRTLRPSGEAFSPPDSRRSANRPVVVGAGPAGLFAALRLAREGWKPILVERGDPAGDRRTQVAAFWRSGTLDPESNVLFGAGGSGLFSDGKLNTRHKDREGRCEVLSELIRAGAPESVLVDAEPHIGSDLLEPLVTRLTEMIADLGGETRFRRRLSDLLLEKGRLRGIGLDSPSGGETVETSFCVLATGHSARDVYSLLSGVGAALEPKPFAVGLRMEMPQDAINASQRGDRTNGGFAASFRISRPPRGDERACYTFCMCPGGMVIPCASEPGCLAVNGMSYHARAGDWGNAAFLVPVTAADFEASGTDVPPALSGVSFQRRWEKESFAAGAPGGDYAVPASRLADFLAGRRGDIPERRGVDRAAAANLSRLLPEEIVFTLRIVLPELLGKLRRVDPDAVLLYGVETRTSSPVRILRTNYGESTVIGGLFPAGEGSGYAGGIMTSALDGWRAAENLMRRVSTRR